MTTAEDFYEAIAHVGAGTLYYLTRKDNSETEFVFEPLIIDTKNKEQTINILKRTTQHPSFIAFPGTPEAYAFMNSDVVKPEGK
jgi:hypothetical protein